MQGIMKPLEGPVKTVGGMIDQVTDQATNMVDTSEKTTISRMGNGAKLMTAMGIGGKGGGQSKDGGNAGGKESGQAQGGGKGDSKGGSKDGGGDFFGTIKSGIHNNLMTLGMMNLKKLGTQILAAGAAKISGAIRKMLTPKVKFKLGNENHELWVEKGQNRNVVMMASDESDIRVNKDIDKETLKQVESGITVAEKKHDPTVEDVQNITNILGHGHERKDDSTGVSEAKSKANPSAADILSGKAKVPTKSKEFDEWFDDLTIEELDKLWDDSKSKKTIKDKLRAGNNHEWYKVSQANKAKRWGLTTQEIKYSAVTKINQKEANDLWFLDIKVPEETKENNNELRGKDRISGRHGDGKKGEKSTHTSEENSASAFAHKELDDLFGECKTKEEYLQKLNKWADAHLALTKKDKGIDDTKNIVKKGRDVLPESIKLQKEDSEE